MDLMMTKPKPDSQRIHPSRPRWKTLLIACGFWQLLLTSMPDASTLWGQNVSQKQPEIGQRVPDFELPLVGQNKFLNLRDEYHNGAVVVIVLRGYPGYQCPICKNQFNAVINRAKALASETKRVILVYPGKTDQLDKQSKRFLGSRKLPHPITVVRDDDMQMVDNWGLRWQARNQTAYPATFLIDQNGRVAWKKVSSSHAGRSTVEEILRALRKL
ncbi:peroxiredoxin family protein [bacterium]|nr:peroxiredoxin family protein [bacterium]